ncbi:MAG: DNA primase [Chloroflexota bacterium]|nr:DNA primase [Chloroflexota bacterium]
MSVVDEIKARLDLVEVVGRVVQLNKAGRNFKGLCPFHSEKTPSFFVFPDSQNWHCFGCGKGGDVFSFVMDYEGWNFRMALEELGRQAGVEIQARTPAQLQATQENDRLRAALEAATTYYHTLLRSAPQAQGARAYLKHRGFTAETIKQFRLGYSLNTWDAMRAALRGQGFSVEELVKAGLLVQKETGRTYDRFRGRVMIPIRDRRGRVIAFGGRVLNPEDQPKYLNSPQTPLFDKSRVLFGLDMASRAIHQEDAVIIVEGYMDVMIPYQAGYHNIVAPMGTALTETHLKLLQQLSKNFILALDPDAAGVHATLRSLETARETLDRQWDAVFNPRGLLGFESQLDADIRVVLLPEGVDPDELILADRAAWQKLLTNAQPIVRFYFQQLLQQENPDEPKGKARIVDAMLPLLRDISNGVEREAYAQEIAMRLNLNPQMLLDRLRAHERVAQVRRDQAVAVAAPDRTAQPTELGSHTLHILLQHPQLLEQVDIALVELEQPPLCDDDFMLENRLIWESWLTVLVDPTLNLTELLLPATAEKVTRWLQIPTDPKEISSLKRDLVRTTLAIRERQIRAELNRVQSLVLESQSQGDLKIQRHATTLSQLHLRLRRVQQALNPRSLENRKGK